MSPPGPALISSSLFKKVGACGTTLKIYPWGGGADSKSGPLTGKFEPNTSGWNYRSGVRRGERLFTPEPPGAPLRVAAGGSLHRQGLSDEPRSINGPLPGDPPSLHGPQRGGDA